MAKPSRAALPPGMPTRTGSVPVGLMLREWRDRRRMTQMDLAGDAGISTRHLSFLETGRTRPSRETLLRLAGQLGIPLRDRNVLLIAGGFAPVFSQRGLDDPELRAARDAVDLVLKGHEPYPALAVDRHWTLVASNAALAPLLPGVNAGLLRPPVNVLRVSLHPEGLAPCIENLSEWTHHIFHRLDQQIDATADTGLIALRSELAALLPPRTGPKGRGAPGSPAVALPLRLRQVDGSVLSFLTITTVFGTPIDVTLAELAIEAFLPADTQTAEALRRGA